MDHSRRYFIKNMAMGCGTAFFFTNFGCSLKLKNLEGEKQDYSMVIADYNKCTGCRTCEAVCSSFNHKQKVNGKLLRGLGNPYYSNIKVHNFNPDADIPAVCALCSDTPCIEACPVSPDTTTGRKALYRDIKTGAVKNDPIRCIGCGECAETCKTERVGVIKQNPITDKPERMCTLCDGDPQCVKHCPYEALSFKTGVLGSNFYGMAPTEIANQLIKKWYKI